MVLGFSVRGLDRREAAGVRDMVRGLNTYLLYRSNELVDAKERWGEATYKAVYPAAFGFDESYDEASRTLTFKQELLIAAEHVADPMLARALNPDGDNFKQMPQYAINARGEPEEFDYRYFLSCIDEDRHPELAEQLEDERAAAQELASEVTEEIIVELKNERYEVEPISYEF